MLRNQLRLGRKPTPATKQIDDEALVRLSELHDQNHEGQDGIRFEKSETRKAIDAEFKPRDLTFLHLLVDQLDVPEFNLPEKYGVQDSAPRWNRQETQGAPYLLGAGASCTVVQHESSEDTSDIIPAGTVVALKRYKHEMDTSNLAADKGLAHVIWQDLRVLCHPELREHENFCKLLYLAWEDFSVVPALVLELAAYGSLSDALRSEFNLSWL